MTYKIAIVGEAWGAEEEAQRAPFVGASGWELNKMLAEAGIHRADCFMTNVFNLRPKPTNDIENLCSKDRAGNFSPIKTGHYLRSEYHGEVARLLQELQSLRPNITILLGNTATWAVLSTSGISKIRGTVTSGAGNLSSFKCLPTFHPAAVLRDWSLRPVTVLDLAKAARESAFPEIRRPERTVYIEPSLADMEWYYREHLLNASIISVDIETRRDQITCIGFADGPRSALVVPFVDDRVLNPSHVGSYWPIREAEILAWEFVRKCCALPGPKVGQNTLYDINFLWTKYGITLNNYEDDTMLLHHALQPESQKGLGFLGSVYTNESSWKLLNRRTATIKRDA